MRPETTIHLIEYGDITPVTHKEGGYVEIHFVIHTKSRWKDVGSHFYTFDKNGVFINGWHNFTVNVSARSRNRITKKNVDNYTALLKRKVGYDALPESAK